MAFLIKAFHVYSLETEDKYLFNADDCELIEKSSEEARQGSAYLIEYPYIPEAEVMEAFIKAQNDRRIDSYFRGVELPAMFWNVFESGEFERVAEYRRFELKYLLDRLEAWLDENGIPHYCDHEDDRLKEVL